MTNPVIKLTIELVPETSWHNNLRSLMGKDAWNTLRKKVYKDYSYKCGICGAKGKLDCHEVWEYDVTSHIQKLVGLIPLCELCHSVKHIGLSELRAAKGEFNLEKLVTHFMKVNKCNREIFEKHKEEALRLFNERSKSNWTLKVGELENVDG